MVLKVAYTIGRGTGKELADIFEQAMLKLSTHYSVSVELHASSRIYHADFPLLEDYDNPKDVETVNQQDAIYYEQYCREQAAQGTHVTLTPAINAQSSYLARQRFQAVNVECFDQGSKSLLLVRDQSKRVYPGSNEHDIFQGNVSRSFDFSTELANRMMTYSIDRARQLWGDGAISSVSLVYMFDHSNGDFNARAKEWSKEYGVRIAFVQPDTVSRSILAHGIRGRHVMIAGNEWAENMHAILLDAFGLGPQEPRCIENVYLHPDVYGLSEFQTVHGSADDVVGNGPVNPVPMVRTAASILENHAGCKGIEAAMENALSSLRRRNLVTPEQGRNQSEFVDCILDTIRAASLAPTYLGLSPTSSGGVASVKERLEGIPEEAAGYRG